VALSRLAGVVALLTIKKPEAGEHRATIGIIVRRLTIARLLPWRIAMRRRT
jgi:hypothetical protein